jgi:hypothetical protein
MKFSSFAMAAAATTAVSASKLTRCGTADPPERLRTALDATAFRYATTYRNSSQTVDTYVHVVTTEQKEGAYTQANVNSQVIILIISASTSRD